MSPEDETDFRVALARMEAKLDVAIAEQRGRLDNHADKLRDRKAEIGALETRVLNLEGRDTVSPKQLGATALGIVTALGALSPLLARLYS